MQRIFSYYSNRPPVRPNYWVLKNKKIMVDNVHRQRVMFVIKSRSKSLKSSSNNTTSVNSKNSLKKNDNILFTTSFYKKLNSSDDNASSKKSPYHILLPYFYFKCVIESFWKENKETDIKPSHCHSKSAFSRTQVKMKSYRFEELLVDESLISRKNEDIWAKSVRKFLKRIFKLIQIYSYSFICYSINTTLNRVIW